MDEETRLAEHEAQLNNYLAGAHGGLEHLEELCDELELQVQNIRNTTGLVRETIELAIEHMKLKAAPKDKAESEPTAEQDAGVKKPATEGELLK